MVDLTPQPGSLITAQAPQPSVSPQQVAAPYEELASNLDKIGGGLGVVAKNFAEQAGARAASLNPDGTVAIQSAPIIGEASQAYTRAAKFAALATASGEARRQEIALSKQYPDDPEAYAAAAGAYRDKAVSQLMQAGHPEVAESLGRIIDGTITYNYRALQNQHQRLVTTSFDRSTKSEIETIDTDLVSLARTGGMDSPDAQRMLSNRIAITKERVANPLLAYPKAQADADLNQLQLQLNTAKFLHDEIDPLLSGNASAGAARAIEVADKALQNDKLTPVERQAYNSEAMKTIRSAVQDQSRREFIEKRAQAQKDEAWENNIIQDSASANPQITGNDIKNNPDMSAMSKMRMLAWQHRQEAGDPLSQVSHSNSVDLFRRMNLPDGDPNKITTLSAVREAYAPLDGSPGKLNRADEEWLEKRLIEARTSTGERITGIRKEFGEAIKPLIDKSNPLLGKIDESGKLQNYQFERFVDQKMDEYRAQGKSPYDLFDPGKPDYLGKPEVIAPFQKTMQQSMRDSIRGLTGQPPTGPLPPPPTGVRGAANVAVPNELWGNPNTPNFERDHLSNVSTPGGATVTVNRVAAGAFQGFLTELEQSGYKIDAIAGYNKRTVFGTNMLSQHAFGNAVDINPTQNPQSETELRTTLPPNVGAMAAKYGISWGGEWKSKKDPMHFEYVGGGGTQVQSAQPRKAGEGVMEYLRRVGGL